MFVPQGTTKAVDILSKSTKYLVYGDPDIDGLIAGSFCLKFLTDFQKQCEFYLNEDRAHGFFLTVEQLEKYKGYTIIAVDFSIDPQVIQQIVDAGINMINIDHHEIYEQSLFVYDSGDYSGVIINNQYCFEPEEYRYQSGAGMVFYVLCAMFPDYMNTQRNQALVGLSLLTDVREIENNDAQSFLMALYNWNDDYSQYLLRTTMDERSFVFGSQQLFDRNYIDYTFSPKFNALFRMNKGYEAMKLFNRVPVLLDISAVRAEQKMITAELQENLTTLVHSDVLEVMSVDISRFQGRPYNITNFIGLVCGRKKDDNGVTTFLLVKEGDMIVRGSVRGKFDGLNYQKIFASHGVSCGGHKGAFGVKPCSLSNIDFTGLVEEITQAEQTFREQIDRSAYITYVTNLGMAVRSTTPNSGKISNTEVEKNPVYNMYVRDEKRLVWDCRDCSYKITKESQNSQYVEYEIDGIRVKCFDKTLTPHNGGYVMPLLVNGYAEYFLRRRQV